MEKVKAPKCCSFPRRYKQTFAICIRMDAERDFNELREEKSERESD
jgi:hypothetical protein